MQKIVVLGVKLGQRMNTAQDFQRVISEHGCIIKTRMGLHHVSDGKCSPSGVILLDLIGETHEQDALEKDLKAIPYAEVQKMIFD